MFNPIYFYESGKVRAQFVSTWKTNNTSTGSSTATQIRLPLISTGTYNFVVDWGDGTSSTITSWNAAATTHTYSVAGTYTLKIKGTCTGWVFGNTGDRLKILSITQWGKLRLGTTQGGYFFGCSNLTLTSVIDVLDLSVTTSLASAFQSTSITTINRINEWNTSAVTNMSSMFASSTFNQNIGNWNVSSVSTFNSMFFNNISFNNGGSPDINNWVLKTTGTVSLQLMFYSSFVFNQPIGNWNVSAVNTMSSMFYNTRAFNQNLSSWTLVTTSSIDAMFTNAWAFNNGLASGVAGTLNWNVSLVTNMTEVFAYTQAFNCDLSSWNVSNVTNFSRMFNAATKFNNGGSSNIDNWVIKTTGTVNMTSMFWGALAFYKALNSWNTSAVTNMSSMFEGSPFNNGLAPGVAGTLSWNTSAVTNMISMFASNSNFNCNIGSWNVSAVTDFSTMFANATAFNNGGSTDINNWSIKTSGPVNMGAMFQSANAFNQDISTKSVTIGGITYTAWDVSKVTNMSNMFRIASAFNKDLSSWDVSKVTTFDSMFLSATVFNNGLAVGAAGTLVWNTLSLVNMNAMFQSANAFNQNIGSWNVSKVTNFANTFAAPRFNNGGSSDINNWILNIISSINMNGMFQSSNFNQPINNWNVSKVTNMGSMFLSNNSFNQPLNLWNTSSVTNMQLMFNAYTGVNVFNQDIGMWNVSNVTNFINFMQFKTPTLFSAANLDSIYNGWSSRPVKPGISITFGSAKYTAASSAGRAILKSSPNNWVIADGGIAA